MPHPQDDGAPLQRPQPSNARRHDGRRCFLALLPLGTAPTPNLLSTRDRIDLISRFSTGSSDRYPSRSTGQFSTVLIWLVDNREPIDWLISERIDLIGRYSSVLIDRFSTV